jgi:predicted O-methyltransferase YrrM
MISNRCLLFLRYIRYRLNASNRHSIHSPFVYKFIELVLRDKRSFPEFNLIEGLRKKLLREPRVITVTDFGAGSLIDSGQQRRIGDIALRTAKPRKYGQLLFRLARFLKAVNILEIGTSLGLTTSYLGSASQEAKVITLEGCPQMADIAKNNLKILGLEKVEVVEGEFDLVLPLAIKQFSFLDLVFIDGNHRKDPTLQYFNLCMQKTNAKTVIVLDDIHWTRDMELAWEEIKKHPQVTLTIDLFFIGLIFFISDIKEKQHFILRY